MKEKNTRQTACICYSEELNSLTYEIHEYSCMFTLAFTPLNISQFYALKIRRSSFLKYIKSIDYRILGSQIAKCSVT